MVFQVAKLMHNDILDAMDGNFYQIYIKRNTAFGAAASPAPAHAANQHHRLRDVMACSNGVAFFQISAEGFLSTFTVPRLHRFPDVLCITFVFRPYPQKTPFQLGLLPTAMLNFEAILPAEINKRFIPNKVMLLRPSEEEKLDIDNIASFTKGFTAIEGGKATGYVCTGFKCQLPTTDVSSLLELLGQN